MSIKISFKKNTNAVFQKITISQKDKVFSIQE